MSWIVAFGQIKTDESFPFAFAFSDTISGGFGRVDTLIGDTTAGGGTLFDRKVSGTGVHNSLKDTMKLYWSASIIADDTLEISTQGGFPSIETMTILPDIPLNIGPFNLYSKYNLFIRPRSISGSTGTGRYYIYIYGW